MLWYSLIISEGESCKSASIVITISPKHISNLRRDIKIFVSGNDLKESKGLVNFGVLTTGFDAPKSNVAIIGRPTQSVTLYSQMIGRVMRGKKAGGNNECKIITVKDPIYGFRDMSESFKYWEELWD